ncbi:ABC-F family ATP-binding cassette domain-containing protein [Paenibacillus turpanensis]|uniref:ABC-F family ATP-binding cassette domain-containing protein n=1 Tax=Paenibacillus turpanensis TaxID=2689078 RepID=UPI00140D0761|nr:ABC-F family ATP-binding cassette domain-containing protein [Paenibacillus turpanensis]
MLLQVSHVSKSYGVTPVLQNITLQIEARERVGLVGVNGAGKSTLLKLIAGELTPDEGGVIFAKESTLGYLAQASAFDQEGTLYGEMLSVFAHLYEMEQQLRRLEKQMSEPQVIEDEKLFAQTANRYSALSDEFRLKGGYETESKIRSVLHGMGFAEFAPDTPISRLSGGQKTRLALARLLLMEPDLLMLDEPTNYLDIPTLTWLEGYLRNYPGAILVVSHDRYFLDALVTSIYEIERNAAKRYTGNYSQYIERKAAEYEIELKHFEKQQEEIARMEDFIRRNISRASTTKRAQSRRKALDKLDRMDRPLGELKRASFRFEIDRVTGQDVLTVDQLGVGYSPEKPLLRGVHFGLKRGDMAALIGPNGTGKSTLLKTLVGQLQPQAGSIRWGSGVRVAYYDQEQTGLTPHNTVLDEVWNEFRHLEEKAIRTVLGNFLFSGDDVAKRISDLSGGEKARVSLAKLMLQRANVLILDEPTNHLDLFSKEVLESALMDYEGTVLFISHDRYFLNKLADRVLELSTDGIRHFLGNYDDYLEKKEELAELSEEAQLSTSKNEAQPTDLEPKKSNYEADKQNKREERAKQRRLAQLEEEISKLEEEISEQEQELTKPEVYGDFQRVQEIQALLDQKKAALEACYDEWGQLAE